MACNMASTSGISLIGRTVMEACAQLAPTRSSNDERVFVNLVCPAISVVTRGEDNAVEEIGISWNGPTLAEVSWSYNE